MKNREKTVQTDKNWIEVLTKTGLSVNIDRPCDMGLVVDTRTLLLHIKNGNMVIICSHAI